jgi:hypothetical protein
MVVGKNKLMRIGLAVAICWCIFLLNYSPLYYEPLAPWMSYGVPLLMLAGLLGSIYASKALRIVGWISVCLFALIEVGAVIPGEDYTLGGPNSPPGLPPHIIPNSILFRRLLLLGGSALLLIIFFYLAGRPRMPKPINDTSENG